MEANNYLSEEQLISLTEIITERLSEIEKNIENFSEVALMLLDDVSGLESELVKQEIVKKLWAISLKNNV